MARKKAEEESINKDAWLGTYGDMITLVLCFFVLLFASSSLDVEKFTAIATALANNPMSVMSTGSSDGLSELIGNGIMEMPLIETKDTTNTPDIYGDVAEFQQMSSDFKTYFAENLASDVIDVTQLEDALIITFKDNVLYDSGSAEVKPEALVILDYIGDELTKHPDMIVEIMGHTDNVPMRGSAIYPNNWYLSFARALSVGLFFIDEKGMSPYQIFPAGRGEYLPIAPNDSDVNRAKNRRVEIKIRKADDTDSIIVY